jgi:integrase
MKAMVITQAGLGCRIGELLGLRVWDVDFLRRTVRIAGQSRQMDRVYSPTKSERGTRNVPLPDVVGVALAQHIKEYPPNEDGVLFTNNAGRTWRHEHYGHRHFKKAVEKAQLPPATSSHDLRHHFVSLMLASGANVAEVAELIGDTPEIVLSTYAHVMGDRRDRARSVIDSAWKVARPDTVQTQAN